MSPQPPATELPPVQQAPAAQPAAPSPPQSDPEVQRMRTELQKQSQTIEQLRAAVLAPPRLAVSNQPIDKTELNRQFLKEPVDMTAAIAQRAAFEAVRAGTQHSYETLVQIAREAVRSKAPEMFDRYNVEIEAAVAQVDPQFRTNINVWQNAFNVIKGQHLDDILDAARKAGEQNRGPAVHISSDGGPAAPSKGAAAPAQEKLSDDEKRVADRLGITHEQYLAGKKHYYGQNDKGPSSWDANITFSSKEKRRQERAARNAKK